MSGEVIAMLIAAISHLAAAFYLGARIFGGPSIPEIRNWFREDGDGGSKVPPNPKADDGKPGFGLPIDASMSKPDYRLRDHASIRQDRKVKHQSTRKVAPARRSEQIK